MASYTVNIEVQHDGEDVFTVETETVEAIDAEAAIRAVEYIWANTVDLIGDAWVDEA